MAGALVVLSLSTLASAQHEWDTGLIGGICGVGERAAVWERSRACLGARGDLLWGRGAPGEFAAGGFVDVGTAGFRDIVFEGGPTALLPIGPVWTGMLSAGPLVRLREAQWEPGVASWAFIGRRPFNYHGRYAMAWGFVVGYERGFGNLSGSTLTMGVQLDGLVLAMPVLFAVEGARGRHSN